MIKEKKIKKENIQIFLLIIFISACILATPFILSYDAGIFSLNNQNLATIGTALSITSPFIGIISGVLVYAAFRQQFKANNKIQEQFDKQSNDSLFFKIVESLNDKVKNSKAYESADTVYEGIHVFQHILGEFKSKLSGNTYEVGKDIITNNIDIIDSEIYRRISISNNYDFPEPKDLLKHLNLGRRETDLSFRKIVKQVGAKHFYDSEYDTRQTTYHTTFKNLRSEYAGVLENYLATLKYLLEFLEQHSDITMYKLYFIGNMTNIERALLFYYCASYSKSTTLTILILKSGLLKEIEPYMEHLYGDISLDIANKEYEHVKSGINLDRADL